jgi:hypothetical protein
MYGVTQHDAPASIMACDVSFVHASVAIRIDILSSSLFCKFDSHHCHQMPRHVDIDVGCSAV